VATYTVYPDAIDSSSQLPLAVDNVTPVKAEIVNRQRSAILAIEAELGIQPSGIYGTARARLDAIEARIADLAEQLEALTIAGGGSIRIKQNGTTVVMAATTVNYTGNGVLVTASGSSTADINVYGGLSEQLVISNTTDGYDLIFSSGDNISLAADDGTGFSIYFSTFSSGAGGGIAITAQDGNDGGNITLTPGTGLGGNDGYIIADGNLKTNALVLEDVVSAFYSSSIWRTGTDLYFTNDDGYTKRLDDFATFGPFIGIAGLESTDVVAPDDDGKGCFVLDPSTIDGYTGAVFTFNAVLETTDVSIPAEIFLYNLTDGYAVDTFSTTPLTTSSIVPVLLQRTLSLYTDLPAEEKLYQVRIRFASGSPTALDRVTCRLAEVRVT
jgi:hypothetical protein